MELTRDQARMQWDIFHEMSEHEQVVFCNDKESGLKAIIAIHDTTLGPALGGCRMYPYRTTEEALEDVLRLSRGMTKKCAAADVDFGGGKAVIIGDPASDKSPELFRAFGQFVESLNGRFYTGTDMGTTMEDFVHAMKETRCIVGVPEEFGGSGDSSVPTAEGVMNSLKAVNHVLVGHQDLTGKTYAIQGLGKVGYKVAIALLRAGANLYVSNLQPEACLDIQAVGKTLGQRVDIVTGDAIFDVKADVFVPCARGGIINDQTIPRFNVLAIAGSANNQLMDVRHADMLNQRGILYAPDYIVNGGGLIQVADELYGSNKKRVQVKTHAIFHTLVDLLTTAKEKQLSSETAAEQFIKQRIVCRSKRNHFFTGHLRPKWAIRQEKGMF
ncbi:MULTISPECIES: Leu/Phe/Val dehydrogenase [Shouchella]|uniref:Glu/Leu/Phe/Val dehydrogenase dimerization domain-containing protein n=2 Tax=Shouchella TaxID=2893057 RepID=A0ABY7W1C9_9BACI|nr:MULTISPECIES: Glu/Leu/Phe/Val dehydrogenase dimerization domain-containing protein [Shouchella]MED4128521.1 Glu/Leu/Phe/Val dehydrogenase dimerization domain-containing protein [Shouchella miscanthi]WDF02361.1 Glu/Leu/Phe/Val dehydrogenase dimerization domain-containing protein [Shouchella hunanensis]